MQYGQLHGSILVSIFPSTSEGGDVAYIPNDNGSWPPPHTTLEVLRQRNMVVQELKQEVGFLFLVADDVPSD